MLLGFLSFLESVFFLIFKNYLLIYVYIYLFIHLFIFDCVWSSLLRAGFLSSCSEWGLLFVAVHGLLIAVASLVAEHGL